MPGITENPDDLRITTYVLCGCFVVVTTLLLIALWNGWLAHHDQWETFGPNYRGEVPWLQNPPPNYHPN